MNMKELKDISWDVTEEEYRADPALSYSTLAKYERGGFNSIPTLFDKVESPSLTLGSAVDSLITGGEEEFESKFIVADFPAIPDSIVVIVKELFRLCSSVNKTIESIKDNMVIHVAEQFNYQSNWKPETRAKVIKEKGSEYYSLLYVAGDKTILNTDTYNTVLAMVDALRTSEATKFYFASDNPFDNIKRYYQLKFKATLDDIDYRCMMDLCIVDYNNKIIIPVDLKTSYKHEYEFYKSFIEWNYQIQARLYYRILLHNLLKDEYFKDFKILDYRFVVVSRNCKPLKWEFASTIVYGDIRSGKNKDILFRDPYKIGKELRYYLDNNSEFPIGIFPNDLNDLTQWINTL